MTDQTIYDRFVASVAAYAELPFLHVPSETAAIYEVEVRDYSYRQANQIVSRLIGEYEALGVGPGARIGLAFENRPVFFLHFLAINALGGSIQPLNPAMAPDELRYQTDHSEAQVIVAAPGFVAALEQATGCPVVTEDQLSNAVPLSLPIQSETDGRDREAAILYTSGTTGQPKGCILSNAYFLAIGDLYTGLGGICTFDPGAERIITPLPVTHMNALACSFMAALQTGSCLIQVDRFHPKSWWRTVRETQATIMHYLGVMPAMLLNFPEEAAENFEGQLKFAFGAGCDPRHHARFEARFGVRLVEAWAMTETGAGAWITAAHEPRHIGTRCFGKAPEGLEWKLVDEEGHPAQKDEANALTGELWVRRAGEDPRQHFFTEYFKDPDATASAWAEGWFHTGDVVRVDDEGYFYFVDRWKNVIRRSGENIAAIEVESVLMRHKAVSACVVVPVPDEIRGDEVAVLIVTDQTSSGEAGEALARSIFDHALANLVYFKAPAFVAFVDGLPMTPSEKVKRNDAKTMMRERIDAGAAYAFGMLKKQRKAG